MEKYWPGFKLVDFYIHFPKRKTNLLTFYSYSLNSVKRTLIERKKNKFSNQKTRFSKMIKDTCVVWRKSSQIVQLTFSIISQAYFVEKLTPALLFLNYL